MWNKCINVRGWSVGWWLTVEKWPFYIDCILSHLYFVFIFILTNLHFILFTFWNFCILCYILSHLYFVTFTFWNFAFCHICILSVLYFITFTFFQILHFVTFTFSHVLHFCFMYLYFSFICILFAFLVLYFLLTVRYQQRTYNQLLYYENVVRRLLSQQVEHLKVRLQVQRC